MQQDYFFGPADPLDDILVAEAIQFLRAHSNVYQTVGTHRRLTDANRSSPRVQNFEVAADIFAAIRPHAHAIKEWVASHAGEVIHGD